MTISDENGQQQRTTEGIDIRTFQEWLVENKDSDVIIRLHFDDPRGYSYLEQLLKKVQSSRIDVTISTHRKEPEIGILIFDLKGLVRKFGMMFLSQPPTLASMVECCNQHLRGGVLFEGAAYPHFEPNNLLLRSTECDSRSLLGVVPSDC